MLSVDLEISWAMALMLGLGQFVVTEPGAWGPLRGEECLLGYMLQAQDQGRKRSVTCGAGVQESSVVRESGGKNALLQAVSMRSRAGL